MVLVSLVLVVVAAITLVIGLLQSGLTIIYISIGCSVAAGLVLAAAVLRGRPEPKFAGAPAAPPGPQPGPAAANQPSGSWQGPQPAPVGAAAPDAQPVTAGATGQVGAPEPAAAAGVGWAPDATQQLEQFDVGEEVEIDEVELPIDDYDSLRASDIIPLLADLDAGELERVRRHEEAGKHRFTVLRRIDSELATREPAGWEVSEEEWEEGVDGDGGVVAVAVVEEVPEDEAEEEAEEELEEELEELEDEFEEEEEEEEEEALAPARARGRSAGFPIADYDQLMMLEVLPRLVDLDTDELLTVRQREESGLSRSTILNRIDRLLEQQMVRPTATARRLSARQAAASRAPARKTAARKAAPRKTAAKKAPARKTAARKAPARKTAARKAPARKTAAKKTAARKTTRES